MSTAVVLEPGGGGVTSLESDEEAERATVFVVDTVEGLAEVVDAAEGVLGRIEAAFSAGNAASVRRSSRSRS